MLVECERSSVSEFSSEAYFREAVILLTLDLADLPKN